jgi:hypothetical protein
MDSFNLNSQGELQVDLSFGAIIKNSISIGVNNLFPLFINTLLWMLTIWIPYINVGTTIGMSVIVLSLSKGKSISVTEIFNPEYRNKMGEYFILMGLKSSSMFFGLILIIFPAIVIRLAFSQAACLMFDKSINPIESISVSNRITYGYKWKMFFAPLVVNMVIGFFFGIIFLLLTAIGSDTGSSLIVIINMIVFICALLLFVPINIGTSAYIYSQLSKRYE